MILTAHAYLAKGGADAIESALALLRKDGIETEGNPDVYVRAYVSLSIEDARDLRDKAALRGIGGKGRTFVIAVPSIPVDAQNTLLKVLEEPPAGAKFIIIVPAPETLLPTLRSRVQMLDLDQGDTEGVISPSVFLKAGKEERLDMLKPLLEKDDDDRRDLAGTLLFLADLEKALAPQKADAAVREGLDAVYRARKYITDKGALAKTLLEQMALLTPTK